MMEGFFFFAFLIWERGEKKRLCSSFNPLPPSLAPLGDSRTIKKKREKRERQKKRKKRKELHGFVSFCLVSSLFHQPLV